MVEGIYVAAQGMSNRTQELDVLANNIANINTPGYKKDGITFHSVFMKQLYQWDPIVEKVSQSYNMDPHLISAVIQVESSGNPYAVSPRGAKGLMQLTDTTAAMLGVRDPFNPEQNIDGGTKYLKQLLDEFGDIRLALAAYNAGPENVKKYGRIPPFKETQEYVSKVLSWRETSLATPRGIAFPIPMEYTNLERGPFESTGSKLDFAIDGDGFFAVSTPEGIKYTRCGSFSLESNGLLITNQGYPVLGEGGEIIINGKDISVSREGEIFVEGSPIDRFLIVNLEKYEKCGNNLFKDTGESKGEVPPQVEEVSILQGYIEKSNLNPMRELVDMTDLIRNYETCQNLISAQDATIELVINQVGRR